LVLAVNLGPRADSFFSMMIDSEVARLLETATFSPIIVFSLIAVFSLIIAFSRITVFSGLMRSSSASDSPIPIPRIPTTRIILTPTIRISRILKTTTSIVYLGYESTFSEMGSGGARPGCELAAPIDLRAFARSEHQGKERWRTHRSHPTHIVCEDKRSRRCKPPRHAAAGRFAWR
jgi:hypothetical protein